MSALLWQAYFNDDLDAFRQLLATGAPSGRPGASALPSTASVGSPGRSLLSASPNARVKSKPGGRPSLGKSRQPANSALTRTEVNSRDAHGVTILHIAASAMVSAADSYALALLENSLLDLYIQDLESGWTALHRALYAGNVSIARALMVKDIEEFTASGGATHAGGLIKIKDREGNSPFDVYTATVAPRAIPHEDGEALIGGGGEDEEEQDAAREDTDDVANGGFFADPARIGDELFMFGSNKNLTLGFGDEDDRHFPERILLKRPQTLLDTFAAAHSKRFPKVPSFYLEDLGEIEKPEVPAPIQFRPMQIKEVELSKLHTAVLTTDSQANLYMCGFGPGGRLGTGDQSTRFHFCSVLGGGLASRKITAIGLGQDHTIAVSSIGEVFTWGSNKHGQLGFATAMPNKDDEPMQLTPKQILGPLKREVILGCSASRTHSVVFTSDSLFTFGKNDGQLGLVDADARSIEKQTIPRKVAASIFANGIKMASAIDKATVFLLEDHEVWVFANYGYAKMTFPLNNPNSFIRSSFSAVTRHDGPNHIVKICGGGDTICGLARTGEVFTATVTQKVEQEQASSTSAPKIRGVLSTPQRIWSLKKDHMAVHDVDVGQDGSVIICTNAGSVWRRVKRAKIKDSNAVTGASEHKPKDYKFSRIPGLTHISAVRANAFGAFAAIRSDCEVLKTQIQVPSSLLWEDTFPLLSFHDLKPAANSQQAKVATAYAVNSDPIMVDDVRQAVFHSKDIESDLGSLFTAVSESENSQFDIFIGSTVSEVRIPAHQFVLMARSSALRKILTAVRQQDSTQSSDTCLAKLQENGTVLIVFKEVNLLSLLNVIFFAYTDSVLAFWNLGRQNSQHSALFRQIRVEVMQLAVKLGMPELERASRLMTNPSRTLHKDLDSAIRFQEFFISGDMEVELQDAKVKLHSALVCQRCPFFEGMFHGRAGGGWLSARYMTSSAEDQTISVDLQHVSSATFSLVVRYLYADVEDALFAHLVAANVEQFLDFILDVLAVANELMIDRLAHLCQKVLGRYVTTRNVCWLLNEVAPCSVTSFKVAALEYICMNLEGMLENRLLDELDEDLVLELGDAVRSNQLAYMPIVRSGRIEAERFELYPELAEQSTRAKQARVDYMTLQSHVQEDEIRMAKLAKSPALKARSSSHDLMFNMEEDDIVLPSREQSRNPRTSESSRKNQSADHGPSSPSSSLPREEVWYDSKGKAIGALSVEASSPFGVSGHQQHYATGQSPYTPKTPPQLPPRDAASPWAAASFGAAKLDMKEIMDQASETHKSSLAAAISSSTGSGSGKSSAFAKLSQKDRKKAIQATKGFQSVEPESMLQPSSTPEPKPSPWRATNKPTAVSIKNELRNSTKAPMDLQSAGRRSSASPSLTMRQTLAGHATGTKPKLDSSESAPAVGQRRSASSHESAPHSTSVNARNSISPQPKSGPLAQPLSGSSQSQTVPQSIRHITPSAAVEPSLQLSMADILALQQTEKNVIKEATAKRSLQEIQEEQAFQEWWDQEEAATKARLEQEAAAQQARSGRRTRDRGQRRSRPDRAKSGGADNQAGSRNEGKRGARSASEKQSGPAIKEAGASSST